MKKRATTGGSNGRNGIVLQFAKLAGVLVSGVVMAVGFALSESSAVQVSSMAGGLAIGSLAYYAVIKF